MLYATGFDRIDHEYYTELIINEPWPGSQSPHRYALLTQGQTIKDPEAFDAVIQIPIEHIVVTSTTHIPALELLGVSHTLMGFPHLDYISSPKTRERINQGEVLELGQAQALNMELLLQAQPDALITFAVSGAQSDLMQLRDSGIPVLYNTDWTETHPLGKAEWIKFFGALYNQSERADSLFQRVASNYLKAKQDAGQQKYAPKVLSGALYKDVWYLPAGESWAAKFISDAHGQYLFAETAGAGSLQLSIEEVIATGRQANVWVGPGQFTSYQELKDANQAYTLFNPFQQQKIYSFSLSKGPTGGVLYFEMAAMRPDLVLKDLISIFHPTALPGHEPIYFKPIKP